MKEDARGGSRTIAIVLNGEVNAQRLLFNGRLAVFTDLNQAGGLYAPFIPVL